MKILSIDVGIKNLAYCLFDTNEINYEIKMWDVIDICSKETKKTCIHNSCNNLAKYYKNNEYYCNKHAKKTTNLKIPSKTTNIKYISKYKIKEIINYCQDNNIDISICNKKTEYIDKIKLFLEKEFFNIVENKNANTINLVDIGKNLVNHFDKLFNNDKIDIVLIENQISPIANRMKTIQGMIAQYFIMKQVETIEFVSSSNKLKNFLHDKKTTYKERKNKSIEILYNELKINKIINKWFNLFDKHLKKDDLADSYLQGLWYFNEIIKK
jgi:hypothetical protein